jgi:signal transduction histidine kinase
MRRAALIFLAAILLPCLALAWLAVRSEQDQQVILQHQQAIIDQGVTDSLALNVRTQMDGVLADFVQRTQQLLAQESGPVELAHGFDQKIRETWPLAQVGFAVDLQGTIYAPTRSDGIPAQTFRKENESFLSNREDAEVYSNAQNQVETILQNARAVTAHEVSNAPKTTSSQAMGDEQALKTKAIASTLTASPADDSSRAVGGASASTAKPSGALDALRSEPTSTDEPTQSPVAAAPPAEPLPPSAPSTDLDTGLFSQGKTKAAESRHALTAVTQDQLPQAGALNPTSTATSPTAATDESDDTSAAAALLPASSTALSGRAVLEKAEKVPATGSAALESPSTTTGMADANAAPESPAALSAPTFSLAENQQATQIARIARQVAPQENTRAPDAALSAIVPAESDFRQLIGQSTSGSIARFLEDKLCLLVWSLPAHDSIVFGAQLDQGKLVDKLRSLVQPEMNRSSLDSSFGGRTNYCLALLDDKGQPLALSLPGFHTDWKHPFVATEIGSVLPHWEAALYLTDPNQVSHSARVLHFTIGLIILLLMVAILAGGSLIVSDVHRQMRLAQQKTDFVSNVSHELKTPLTSIRMFADMLAEGRVAEPDKQATYLRIISAESARLTRLINNVLDFARLERGAPAGERQPCDLVEAAREVVETCLPHLESASVSVGLEVEAESLPLLGDRDALSQIILNLVSNAEKYGGGEVVVRVRRQDGPAGLMGCVDVLDRGPGIAARLVETAFSPFQRLDDSLASGIPGSGLGLTLARRMARAHGGDITYQSRAGGGSCFTLTLPLSVKK